MTISILQPQRPQPANDGHVRDNLTADERLLKQAVARCLKAQLAEVHGRLVGGAVEKGGPGSGSWDGPGQPRFAKAGEVPIPVSEFDKGMREKEFVMPKRAKQNDAELVWVDVKKFEEGFKKNDSQYIGEGGTGGISNRYSSFAEYYKANKEIEVSEVVISKGTWDEKGTVQFINGRHRYAYMRDQGATTIPVALFLSPDTMELSEARKEGIVKEFNLKFTFSIKGGPASAVPSSTKPWDDMVMREVRPIWFGLFKKGGDKALQNIRRFPKHARKMAVLSWAEMEVSERVAVKEFMGVMRRSSEKIAGDLGSQELPAPTSLKASPSIVIPEWIEDPDVLDALEREMFKFAHGINQTTADDLRAELMAGMENGETIPQLADRISGLSDEWVEGWRSEMIARTETARAFSTGHIEAWRSTGVVDRKVWVAAGDSCPFCQQMDGTVVELDENFFDQGDEQATNWKGQEVVMGHDYSDVNGPPLHPNCYLHHTVMVTTDAGKKMISKIKVGDRVLTARGRFRPVTRILEKTGHYKGRAVRIMYRGWKDWGFTNQNSVTTTPEHPFLTDGGWKAAQDVTPNDSLYVLASYCLACGKKIPFWRKYCSDECVYVDQPEIGEKISEIKKQRNWMKGRTGALHHSWRGGKIWWRGKDWDVLKRKIVERDGFMCQDCGMTEEACLEKSGQPLHVHHLNPYRDSFDNSPQNLITLCVSCHAKREGTVNSRFLKRGGVSFIDTPVLAVQHIDNFKGERLYNFSVAEDESYIAQGIVNHNCRCVLVAELDEEKMYVQKGGPGSGNFGHEGRPGEVGGSGGGGETGETPLISAGAKFSTNKKENIQVAIEAIKNLGIKTHIVGTDIPQHIRDGIKKKGAAFYWQNPETGKPEIIINQYHRVWDDPKTFYVQHGPKGDRFYSSDNPARGLIHEYAHYKYGDTADAESVFINDHSFRETVKQEVSTYASSAVREFIAEVFTGVSTGHIYSDLIMDRYNRYKQERNN